MLLPTQISPIQPNERKATAPYNFVPLTNKIVTLAIDDLPDHDCYDLNRHTGYFDVELTTKSALYVRCALSRSLFDRDQKKQDCNGQPVDDQTPYVNRIKNTPDFFYTERSLEPVIPGSSLRGMLRALLEIVSFGKFERITKKRLFYRTVDDSNLGREYNRRVVDDSLGSQSDGTNPSAPAYRSLVRGGFFRINPNGECYIEECIVARVHKSDLVSTFGLPNPATLYIGNPPNKIPNPSYQHQKVWANYDSVEQLYFFQEQRNPNNNRIIHRDLYLKFRRASNIKNQQDSTKSEGILVLTGDVPRKKYSFIFFHKTPANRINIPNDNCEEDINKRLLDLFHGDDQLTQWQCRAFPATPNRRQAGYLADGDPVFFLTDPANSNQLVFFGRAQMFRLPYKKLPIDLVPETLRQPLDIDFADALFGYVRQKSDFDGRQTRPEQGDKRRSYAGRISITDAVLIGSQDRNDIWLNNQPITPAIMSTPKPTSIQHYLVQTSAVKNALNHYDSTDTVIRGHKLYWHKGVVTTAQLEDLNANPASTQHTRFKPVKEGIKFKFRVYFENLSDVELGALCWILRPAVENNKTYCHKLGMGKSFGMGAVLLQPTLYLTGRQSRYSSLFNNNDWQTGLTNVQGESLSDQNTLRNRVKDFEKFISQKLGQPYNDNYRLYRDNRIERLLHMMEWPGVINRDHIALMKIDQDVNGRPVFKKRPVLPDPLDILTRADPISLQPQSPITLRILKDRINKFYGVNIPELKLQDLANEIGALTNGTEKCQCARHYHEWILGNKKLHARYKSSDWFKIVQAICDGCPQ